MEVGIKYDSDKDRWDLLPIKAIIQLVKVLTYGAKKYAPENWRKLEQPKDRYFSAAMRHLTSWKMGEKTDPESGLPHLAHAVCSLVFICELEEDGK